MVQTRRTINHLVVINQIKVRTLNSEITLFTLSIEKNNFKSCWFRLNDQTAFLLFRIVRRGGDSG